MWKWLLPIRESSHSSRIQNDMVICYSLYFISIQMMSFVLDWTILKHVQVFHIQKVKISDNKEATERWITEEI